MSDYEWPVSKSVAVNKGEWTMERYVVKINEIEKLTHDTLRISTGRPPGFLFESGQATSLAPRMEGWENDMRPFTIASTPADPMLEFIIKTYPEHDGTTEKLLAARVGDELVINGVYGTITYKGEGLFIAGGTGITPFISIFRDLNSRGAIGNNKLIYTNKTREDILLEKEITGYLEDRVSFMLSREKAAGYLHGRIDRDLLKQHLWWDDLWIYLCGTPAMMNAVEEQLSSLGVSRDRLVKEEW